MIPKAVLGNTTRREATARYSIILEVVNNGIPGSEVGDINEYGHN